jgi:hypothetical protein
MENATRTRGPRPDALNSVPQLEAIYKSVEAARALFPINTPLMVSCKAN